MTSIPKISKIATVQNLLWLALTLALAGSLWHVADTFSSIDHRPGLGWVQAIAVDIGLIALALGIAKRRKAAKPTGVYWLGLGLFTVISVYANLDYAFRSINGGLSPNWIQASKPWVMAATLPVLALYLAEIVGSQAMSHQPDADLTETPAKLIEPLHVPDTNEPYTCRYCYEPQKNQAALNVHEGRYCTARSVEPTKPTEAATNGKT